MQRRQRSWIVNGCTSLNLLLGMATIWLSCQGQLLPAALCLVMSVVWDAADGYLARRWEVGSEFGAQLDSLADMTSFGIGAGMFLRAWLSLHHSSALALLVAFWFALAASWRLARFNIGPKLVGEFYGLPTTAAATLVVITYLTCPQLSQHGLSLPLAAGLAYLMVSPLPYPKWTRAAALPQWLWLLLLLAASMRLQVTIWTCSALYLSAGPWIWWRRRRAEALS